MVIPKLYKRVTAMLYGLDRLDCTMADLQNIHLVPSSVYPEDPPSCRQTCIKHVRNHI